MKKETKKEQFKVGDEVMLLDDMTCGYTVKAVYTEKDIVASIFSTEVEKMVKVVLDNNRVYKEEELSFYSEPLRRLAVEVMTLKNTGGTVSKKPNFFKRLFR